MIPFLKPKIWYAFQGLPIERIEFTDRLPWSKCLVLTNNLMYILKYNQLADTFKTLINKTKSDINRGVTFEEYITVFDNYIRKYDSKYEVIQSNERQSSSMIIESEPTEDIQKRGATLGSRRTSEPQIMYSKSNTDISPVLKSFDDYCWTLFRSKHLPNISSQSALDDCYFDLWLLFITYSLKCPETDEVTIPVMMDAVEATYWCSRIRDLLGSRRRFEEIEIEENITGVSYKQFFNMVQDIFKNATLAETVVDVALRELSEEALEGVIMKGAIKIEKYTRFCVLKSNFLMIYNSKVSATNFRSCFVISGDTEILAGSNKIQMKTPGFQHITVINIEISDIHLFNKWRTAFVDAVEFAKANVLNPAMAEARRRESDREIKRETIRKKRIEMEMKIEDERKERCKLTDSMEQQLLLANQRLVTIREQMVKEIDEKESLIKQNEKIRKETEVHIKLIINEQHTQYKIQLQKLKEIESEKNNLNEMLQASIEEKTNEEMKRTILEDKHREAEQMLLEAEEKIHSLGKLSEQLEKALDDEKQAKEDEKAVLKDILVLLEEEQQSKETMESLLLQQNQEIQKHNIFAKELQSERIRIQNISEEKDKLNKLLEDTRQKMQSTGNSVKKLDSKVSQIAENIFGKEETRLPVSHRGEGFMPKSMFQQDKKKAN